MKKLERIIVSIKIEISSRVRSGRMTRWLLSLIFLVVLPACSFPGLEEPQETAKIEKVEQAVPKVQIAIEQKESEEETKAALKLEIIELKEEKEKNEEPEKVSKPTEGEEKSKEKESIAKSEKEEDHRKDSSRDESITGVSSFEKEVVELVNQEREKYGYSPLQIDTRLTVVARKKSADMRDNRYFSHQSPTYGSPFDMLEKENIRYTMAGENIAAGQRTPSQVVKDWMNSEGHRQNILNPNYTHIGVGYCQGGSYGTYWTQLFIKK